MLNAGRMFGVDKQVNMKRGQKRGNDGKVVQARGTERSGNV